ncbi:MAG: sialidase family protein [Acutalibacteraceae bacterium]
MKKISDAVHGIVNRKTGSIFDYQGWPSVCRDENGTLYAVASGFRMQHICPCGKTVLYISRNNGETWTQPMVINDTYLDDRDAGIVYLGGGRLLVTWFSHPAQLYLDGCLRDGTLHYALPMNKNAAVGMIDSLNYLSPQDAQGGSFIRISEDYGVTWSDAIQVPVSSPHGPTLCRDGSLLYLGKEMYSNGAVAEKSISAYASRDGGYTWEYLSTLSLPQGTNSGNFHEPYGIELPDGRLFGAVRAEGNNVPHGFTMYTTVSTDGGKSWSALACTDVSGSPPHLLLHSSGALICSYGRREKPFGEHAMVSYDYGKTWAEDYVIDDNTQDNDLGYPASVELADGSILTVYYQKLPGDKKCSILYTKWRLPQKAQ